MTPQFIVGLLIVGLLAGFMSSMVGIGGGVIIVPALVLIFGMNQKMAQGTSLLMLALPVAAAGAYQYWKAGNLDWRASLILAATFIVGGYFGGLLANRLDTTLIKRIFACFMIVVAVKYLFFDKPKAKPTSAPTNSPSGIGLVNPKSEIRNAEGLDEANPKS